MFPTPEESQKVREGLAAGIEAVISKRRQYREDLANGKITPEEHAKLQKELTSIIFGNNQKYGSMGTGLDGHGEPVDYSTLTIQEIYRLRGWAGKTNNSEILADIKAHLNIRIGAGDTPYPFVQHEVELAEVISMSPPEVWIVVDHQITDTQKAERASHALVSEIHQLSGGDIKVSLHSGELPEINHRDKHVVLLAMSHGFCVLKARGTMTSGKVIKRPL